MENRKKENFEIEDLINQAREETERKLGNALNSFETMKTEPGYILKMFNGKGSYNEITDVVGLFGKQFNVHDMQGYLYSILIPYLKKEIDDSLEYNYTENQYSSALSVSCLGYSVGHISIYHHNLRIFSSINIETGKNNIEIYDKELEKLASSLEYYKQVKETPLKACKSIKDIAYYIFKNRKIKESVDGIIHKVENKIEWYQNIKKDAQEKLARDTKYEYIIKEKTQKLEKYFKNIGYEIY